MHQGERGTLNPGRLPVDFRRIPSNSAIVRWFWCATWELPTVVRQPLLPFPACNLAVEPAGVGLAGPTTGASHRDLVGTGWVVAALLQPAAVPAFSADPAAIRDRYVMLDEPDLHADVAASADVSAAVPVLEQFIAERVGDVGDEALLANELARRIDEDSSLTTVPEVAEALAVSVRTVHRLAARYIGLSPHAMIRRRRLQEAAQRLREEPAAPIADVAADAGYADHAHFAKDFTRTLGMSPSAYRKGLRQSDANS